MFNVKVTTKADLENQTITQEIDDLSGNIIRRVLELQESQTRNALIKLGWSPPDADTKPAESPVGSAALSSEQPATTGERQPSGEVPMATPCCGYTPKAPTPWPVFWNPYNGVVQCHNCGTIYRPIDRVLS